MSDRDRLRGQDPHDEHHDDDRSAMQQDQGGRVPDRDAGPDYAYTAGREDLSRRPGGGVRARRPDDEPADHDERLPDDEPDADR